MDSALICHRFFIDFRMVVHGMFMIFAYRLDAKMEGLNIVKVRFSSHACCNLRGSGGSGTSMKNRVVSIISFHLLISFICVLASTSVPFWRPFRAFVHTFS